MDLNENENTQNINSIQTNYKYFMYVMHRNLMSLKQESLIFNTK